MSSEIEVQAWSSNEYTNLALVQEVKKHPCLYNNTIPEYSQKDLTAQVWQDIAEKFGCTVATAKGKWKNLRASYHRYVAQSAKKKNRRVYYLAKDMNYLRPFLLDIDDEQANNKPEECDQDGDGNCPDEQTELDITISHVQGAESFEEETHHDVSEGEGDNPSSFTFLDEEFDNAILNKHFNNTLEQEASEERLKPSEKLTAMPTIIQCVRSTDDSIRNNLSNYQNPRRQFIMSLLPEVNGMTEAQFFKFKRKLFRLIDNLMVEDQ